MKTKVIETKPQDFYKIREDIRRKRKKKKVVISYLERNYTKIKLEVYTELRRRLNNKCGVSCPLSSG